MADGAPHQIPLDEMLVRRLLELELRQVKEDVARLEKAATASPPWWTSYLFAVLFAMISGWIGMIHVTVARISAVQYQHLYIPPALEDVKRRLSSSEALALRIPYMENQLKEFGAKMEGQGRDFGIKLDRLFEQRGRQGQTAPDELPAEMEGGGNHGPH